MTRLKHGLKATRVKAGRSVAFKTTVILFVVSVVLTLTAMLCMFATLVSENNILSNSMDSAVSLIQDVKQEQVIVNEILGE